MNRPPSFSYRRPEDRAGVIDAVADGAIAYAGGTDLLPRLKSGLAAADVLVDIKSTDLGASIDVRDGRIRLGPLVTLSELATDPQISDLAPVLAAAASSAATLQLRNRATIAGNLLQESRCPYYRNEQIDCWLKGGDDCPALAPGGVHEHLAIFQTGGACVTVHPSDPANALVALDAEVEISSGSSTRTILVADLLSPPTDDRRALHTLGRDELITAISFDSAPRSTYVKEMDRAAWAFAVVGVAVVLPGEAPTISEARVVAGAVANVPRRLREVESALDGSDLEAVDVAAAAALAGTGADPLPGNGYKVAVLEGAVARALHRLRG